MSGRVVRSLDVMPNDSATERGLPRTPLDSTWLTLLHDLDVTPAEVLRAAGLPEDMLVRGEKVSFDTFLRFWAALDERVEHPALPVYMAERVTTEAFAPSLFAALCSRNGAEAIARLKTYKQLMGPGYYALSSEADGALRIEVRVSHGATALPRSLVITELAVALQLIRLGSRSQVRPQAFTVLDLPRPQRPYARFFGVAPQAGTHDAIVLSAADAQRPFVTHNPGMWQVFEPSLRARLSELDEAASTRARVRGVLVEMLPAGHATVDDVASRLGLSRRTLQRQLSVEQTSYQAVLSEVRGELARHYLRRTRLSPAEIAYLLAFSDPRSFFRAFRSWTGTSPERFRATH